MPALRSLPIFCFTEHDEIGVHEMKVDMQVDIWRFVILKPNFSMTVFLDPRLGGFFFSPTSELKTARKLKYS